MPVLRELQEVFLNALYASDGRRVAMHIASSSVEEAAARLDVYRNNLRETFISTLEAGFPIVARLGGAEWFRQTVLGYMQCHPSRSGDLRLIGEHFAAYLAEQLHATTYEYFADVARLSWAYQEVIDAPDAPALDLSAIARIASTRYEDLVLQPHPACRVVASPYPILAIWRANQPEIVEPPFISLDAGGQHVLVIRRPDHIELRELSLTEHLILGEFAAGASLGRIIERAWIAEHAFDVPDAVSALAQAGVFAAFHLRGSDHAGQDDSHAR